MANRRRRPAETLAASGLALIIHGDASKTDHVRTEIVHATGHLNVAAFTADLTLTSQARTFSDAVKEEHGHLECSSRTAAGGFASAQVGGPFSTTTQSWSTTTA